MKKLSKDGSKHVTDEFFNTWIMIFGAVLSIIGAAFLIYFSLKEEKLWHLLAFAIYGGTLVNLFICSALHHGVDGSEKTEHLLRQLDYYAVFILIAGSFTPFCLIVLRNDLGFLILALVWAFAIIGIGLKAFIPKISKWIILSFYLGMGWLGVFLASPLYEKLSNGVFLILLGGIFFTVGAVIYYKEYPNPIPGKFGFHEIWHLHVLAGTACHFFVSYLYLLPYP